MAKLFAFATLAGCAGLATADSFLAKSPSVLLAEDVKQVLLSEMMGRSDGARLVQIEGQLRPMYAALPKGEQGLLEMATVRYALHRHFLKQYGWFVKGLDSGGEAWNSSGSATVLKARAPAYILSLFEEHLNGKGMGLHDLAVFAATLADLIHAEATGTLEKIYAAMGLPTHGPVESSLAEAALKSFVVAHLLGSGARIEVASDLKAMQAQLDYQYPNQEDTNMWVDDFRHTYKLEQQRSTRNPFVPHVPSFDETAAFVLQFGHNFGSFQNLECHTMKRKLVEMEHQGSGRVLLSKFYSSALAGGWEFMESVEYLRNQGALDESDPSSPSVVIANYMNSRMNCLTASDYYAVCCLDECDALLARLEEKIAVPRAEPARIAEVVLNMQSDTVDAPRNLSSALLSRLDDIAQTNSGLVPLHGRLFAQWMHHAYPRECSFPHVAGAVQPMYPVEFAMAMGHELLEASQEVMEMHAARGAENSENSESSESSEKPVVLPWSHEEELVAEHNFGVHRAAPRRAVARAGITAFKAVAALVALASFAVPMVRTCKVAFGAASDSKEQSLMV